MGGGGWLALPDNSRNNFYMYFCLFATALNPNLTRVPFTNKSRQILVILMGSRPSCVNGNI